MALSSQVSRTIIEALISFALARRDGKESKLPIGKASKLPTGRGVCSRSWEIVVATRGPQSDAYHVQVLNANPPGTRDLLGSSGLLWS